jgi:hypothetical protein
MYPVALYGVSGGSYPRLAGLLRLAAVLSSYQVVPALHAVVRLCDCAFYLAPLHLRRRWLPAAGRIQDPD